MRREQRRNVRGGRRTLALVGAFVLAWVGPGTALAASTNPIAAQEWALNVLNVTTVRQQFHAHGAGVVVAVIDSGVDPNQPDLRGRLVDGVNVVDPNHPTSDYGDSTAVSHGTGVATIIAGYPHTDSNGNHYGMIGLADEAKIMPIKVGDGEDGIHDDSIIAGINYAVAHGAQVLNLSLTSSGVSAVDPEEVSAVNAALAHGVVVVFCAGNDGETGDEVNSLALVPGVLDVGGVDSNGQKFAEGHYGGDVNVAAPAKDVEVGMVNGKYDQTHEGTSFAAPWVSGEAALLIAEHPTWTSGQIVAAIIDNTVQSAGRQTKPGQRVDDNVGYGMIDPVAALGAAEPASKANPLGGPAITSGQGQSASTAAGAGRTSPGRAGPPSPGTTATASSSTASSSTMPLIIGIAAAVVVLGGLLVFLLVRRKRNGGGKGGPGGGGAGGNAHYPPGYPPQSGHAQQNAYPPQGAYGQQNAYPAQGGYGQQQGGYGQRGGYPPRVGPPSQGGYAQPGQQNPYGT